MSTRNTVVELWLSESEYQCVKEAAADAHLDLAQYARLMVLAASGMGGVLEHLERAGEASVLVDKTPGFEVRVRRTGGEE